MILGLGISVMVTRSAVRTKREMMVRFHHTSTRLKLWVVLDIYIKINHMKQMIKEKLNTLLETKVIGQEGISKRIAELTDQKNRYISQRNDLNKKIKELEKEIKKWETEISPNQTTLFDL